MRVLIVNDEDQRDLISELTGAEIDCMHVRTLQEWDALTREDLGTYDVIIMDGYLGWSRGEFEPVTGAGLVMELREERGFKGCILAASSSGSSNLTMVEVGADEVCDFDHLPVQLVRLKQ